MQIFSQRFLLRLSFGLKGQPRSSRRERASTAVLGLCLLFAVTTPAQKQGTTRIEHGSKPTFTEFDAPGAGTSALQGTLGIGINTAEAITGMYVDSSNVYHGFVRPAKGAIATIDAPGAGTGTFEGTIALSINTTGAIAGMYYDSSDAYHGFVRAATGKITTFNAPGAGTATHHGTIPICINSAGAITGTFKDANGVGHGFLRSPAGKITTIDAPGAGKGATQGTAGLSINTAGVIAGAYADANGVIHGFVRAATGKITTFNVPGKGTIPISINTAGVITGAYRDSSAVNHGFVRAVTGKITTFTVPGAGKGTGMLQGTVGASINTTGTIAGTYADKNNVNHGFVRAATGKITTFDAPGAGSDGLLAWLTIKGKGPPDQGTAGFGINAAGAIAGTYADKSGVYHGFLRTP